MYLFMFGIFKNYMNPFFFTRNHQGDVYNNTSFRNICSINILFNKLHTIDSLQKMKHDLKKKTF